MLEEDGHNGMENGGGTDANAMMTSLLNIFKKLRTITVGIILD